MLYRLLDSIELFADEVIINGTSETFARGSFAIQVQDYDPATFSGLDFAVELGPVEEAVNSTEDIDSDLIVSEVNDPTAWISVSAFSVTRRAVRNVVEEVERRRLSFTLFRRDTLFQDHAVNISSVVIGVQSQLSNVTVGFLKPAMTNTPESEDITYNTSCVIWDEDEEGK